jgi:signal transduction histidine kinase
MRLGLRGRILLLVLVALAPPTVVTLIVALEERHEAREQAQGDLLDSGRLVGADVGRVIDSTASFMGAVSKELAQEPTLRHCQDLLVLVPRSTSLYSSVGVASTDGKVRCGATAQGLAQPTMSVDVAGSSWFRAARGHGGFVLGRFGEDPLRNGMKALVAAYPVSGRMGARPRVMFAALDVRRLSEATALADVPRGVAFTLLDQRGTVIARTPDGARLVGKRFPQRSLVETILGERQGTAEVTGRDGVARIQAYTPVGGRAGNHMFLTASRTSSAVFADPTHDMRTFLLFAALGVGLALAFSYLVTKLLLQRWTSAVVDSARRFGSGDLTARAPVPQGLGELTVVAEALNAAADDIERRQLEHSRLLAELVAAEEETRRRIAADIHDDTAQAVAAAGLRMDALVAELRDPAAREVGLNARQALGEANRRLRRLLFELRPPALDEAGLAAALELFLTDAFSHNGFDWRVDNQLATEPSPEVRAILYRVALEALTNVRKHAHASLVEVSLERRGAGVAVRVRDDGDGFELPPPGAAAGPGHIGLLSMRERAEAAGGLFALTSAPGAGTTVDFWMPEPNGRPIPGSRGA